MAEAFGFIFAIAGLYSSCIEAFDQIRAARSFGRDYEILSTRFDVRKARFLQWGDGVGLQYSTTQKVGGIPRCKARA
jgi:Prion-inhibition and propagation